MKSNVKKLSECKREIELEIPENEVTEEFEKIIVQYSARSKIRGFRPGKAPKEIIKRMYYSEIKESLINSLAPKALNNELKALNLSLAGMPIINDFYFKEGHPLRFKAQFEVWPEFSLPEYKNIKVKKKSTSVSEKEVNESLEELRLKSAQYIPVEGRGVAEEDYVVAEIKGKDTKTKKHLPTEKVVILAGHIENEKILNESLKGLKENEETNFTIHYGKDHQNKKLAGKKIEYNLKVISIKEKSLPEINDDFAKDLGEFESLKELKAKINKDLISSKESIAKREMAEEIVENISEKLSFELPERIIQQEQLSVLRQFLASQPQQSLKKEDIENLKSEAKKKAEKNLKNHLVLRKISEKENLKVSEEEITEELRAIAETNNVSLAQVIDSINKEGKREELRDNILIKKTVDFLVECAIIE